MQISLKLRFLNCADFHSKLLILNGRFLYIFKFGRFGEYTFRMLLRLFDRK